MNLLLSIFMFFGSFAATCADDKASLKTFSKHLYSDADCREASMFVCAHNLMHVVNSAILLDDGFVEFKYVGKDGRLQIVKEELNDAQKSLHLQMCARLQGQLDVLREDLKNMRVDAALWPAIVVDCFMHGSNDEVAKAEAKATLLERAKKNFFGLKNTEAELRNFEIYCEGKPLYWDSMPEEAMQHICDFAGALIGAWYARISNVIGMIEKHESRGLAVNYTIKAGLPPYCDDKAHIVIVNPKCRQKSGVLEVSVGFGRAPELKTLVQEHGLDSLIRTMLSISARTELHDIDISSAEREFIELADARLRRSVKRFFKSYFFAQKQHENYWLAYMLDFVMEGVPESELLARQKANLCDYLRSGKKLLGMGHPNDAEASSNAIALLEGRKVLSSCIFFEKAKDDVGVKRSSGVEGFMRLLVEEMKDAYFSLCAHIHDSREYKKEA